MKKNIFKKYWAAWVVVAVVVVLGVVLVINNSQQGGNNNGGLGSSSLSTTSCINNAGKICKTAISSDGKCSGLTGTQKCSNGVWGDCTTTSDPCKNKDCGNCLNGTGSCGTCQTYFVCTNGKCTCTPKTCKQLGKKCGTWPDGCGGNVTCGTCPVNSWNDYCSNGTCVHCLDYLRTCSQMSCGRFPDGCGYGGYIDCGCPTGYICYYGDCIVYKSPGGLPVRPRW